MAQNGEKEPVFDIPKECKAGVVINEGPNFSVEVQMVPVPQPGPTEVLIKLNTTGLCYSDIHYMLGDLPVPSMASYGVRSPGHEGAGIIVKKGENCKRLKVGQRVGFKPIFDVCHMCDLCWSDKECYCAEARYTGLAVPGSYQQYVLLPERYTSPIPDGVDDVVAGPIMCSGATMYRAIRESKLTANKWAVFPGGGGGLGIQGVQLAKSMGIRCIVIDSGATKKELALRMGAEHFVDFKEVKDVGAEVIKICDGIGAHGVFVTAPPAYKTAMSLIGSRVGAVVMCVGLPPPDTVTIGGDPASFVFRNVTVKGSLVGNMSDVNTVLKYAERGELKQICEVWPFSKLPEAVEKLRTSNVTGRIVMDYNAD